MPLRSTFIASLVIGTLAGLVLSLAQFFLINPIIFQAESFEVAGHDHGSHDHSAEAWAPADGIERSGYTAVANIFAGIGFTAVLLAIISQCQALHLTHLTAVKGLLWGMGGFSVFFIAPAIGVPPEIPGIEAAPIEHRQLWWAATVLLVGLGLLVVAFANWPMKPIGLVLLALPYSIYIPHASGPAFAHPDPDAVAALTELHQQFIVMSGLGNIVFWLVIGLLSGAYFQHLRSKQNETLLQPPLEVY